MSGRYENELHLENSIMTGLSGYPGYLADFCEESAGSQMASKKTCINAVKRFIDYLKRNQIINVDDIDEWSKVTSRMIKDYFKAIKTVTRKDGTTKTLKGKTLEDYLISINMFFDWLLSDRIIPENPCPTIKEMRKGIFKKEMTSKEVVAMTPEEVKHVAETIRNNSGSPARDECLFMLGCCTGLRATALSEIDVDDIDFSERRLFVIEKGNYTRDILLDSQTVDLIKKCIAERDGIPGFAGFRALFCKADYSGKPKRISADYIGDIISRFTADLDKHITPHKMRSTCITTVYNRTHNVFAAAKAAGHHNVSNTQRYINTTDEERRVAEDVASVFY